MRRQSLKIETLVSVRGNAEQSLRSVLIADRQNAELARRFLAWPWKRWLANKFNEMRESWFVKETLSHRTGLAAEALVYLGEHVDCCGRISAGVEKTLIESKIITVQNPCPDFVGPVKKHIIRVFGHLGGRRRRAALAAQTLGKKPSLRLAEFAARNFIDDEDAAGNFESRELRCGKAAKLSRAKRRFG